MNKTTLEDFFTADKAEEGRKLPLYLPDGTKTDHWMLVRGIDSASFKRAEAKAKREGAKLAGEGDADDKIETINELQRKCVASLVADWSFDIPCTEEEIVKLFEKAPQIEDAVNTFAARRTLFFAKESKVSTSGSKQP